MTSYQIELSYYDGNKSLQFERYQNVVSDHASTALARAIAKFHGDRKPLIFEIHRIVIEKEIQLRMK